MSILVEFDLLEQIQQEYSGAGSKLDAFKRLLIKKANVGFTKKAVERGSLRRRASTARKEEAKANTRRASSILEAKALANNIHPHHLAQRTSTENAATATDGATSEQIAGS